MRRKILAGNWKLHCTRAEASDLANALAAQLTANQGAEVVVCPPFTALQTVGALLEGSAIALGAQNVFWKEKGAYTGQIAPRMLTVLGCRYVIVGHSEARGRFGVPEPDFDADILASFGDNDITVNLKLRAALAGGLIPICCVGETLSERNANKTEATISEQTAAALREVTAEQAAGLVFAYEPVWAIGTGEVCPAGEADRICGVVRATVGKLYGDTVAEAVRVQYGGSVKPDNAHELLSKPHIDGALVGGASLKAADFAAIVAAA